VRTRRYLHIGCPKAVSTTLQRDFLDVHPALRHLGVGCGGNVDYRDAGLELAIEGHVMFCRELSYRDKVAAVRGHLAEHFAAAEADPAILAVGVSNESLCFGYSPGHVDTAEKARRLRDLFGPDTSVILVVRNQPALLRSLHRESIRNGYAGTLDEFLHYAYLHQDRSFLSDFLFDRTVGYYGELFGPQNVHVLPLEDYLTGGRLTETGAGHTALTDRLSAILGVPALPLTLGKHNEPLDTAVLEAKRRLNASHPHDLGHALLAGVVNGHRLRQVYAEDLHWDAEPWLYEDVRRKRALIAEATATAAQPLDDSVSPELGGRLLEMFAASNRQLARLLGTELPAAYGDPSF
jgi:hypothetical protein